MLGRLVEGLMDNRFSPDEETTIVVECRRCGTSLEDADCCPYCGESETVRFEI